jgi:hypothetical protein
MFLNGMNLHVEASKKQFRFAFNIPTAPEDGAYVVSGQLSGRLPVQSLRR